MVTTSEDVAQYMPTPYPIAAGTNNRKLIDAFHTGYIGPMFDDIDALSATSHVPNMTGSALDKWGGGTLGVVRRVNETDADYLIRIKGDVRRRFGGSTLDDIIDFINLVLGGEAGAGDIVITENSDGSNGYRAAYYTVSINTSLILALGIPALSIPATLADIEDILNETAAAGVKGEIILQTAAEFDTALWDAEESIWGS